MKKVLLSIACLLLIFASCSHSDNNETEPNPNPSPSPEPTENPYKTGIDLSVTKTDHWTYEDIAPNLRMIGYGYDATGKYAHPAWIKAPVIDIEGLIAEKNDAVTIRKYLSGSGELSYAGTAKESREWLAGLAGFSKNEITDYKNLYKEMFKNEFKEDTSFPNINYYYTGFSGMSTTHIIKIVATNYSFNKYVKKHITDEFKADIENKTAEEIIQKYGTHVMISIYLGRRLDYMYRCTSSDKNLTHDWLGYRRSQFIDKENKIAEPRTEKPLKENLYVQSIAGTKQSPNVWMMDITNSPTEVLQYIPLENEFEDKSTLIKFSRGDSQNNMGIRPIYQFVSDPAKQTEIKKAFEKHMGKKN